MVHPGKHEPLVDRRTWDRVQALLCGKTYKAHQFTYAGGVARCAHCGNLVTGEEVTKKASGKLYRYYRCTMYNLKDHPRIRVTERQLDDQVLAVFRSIEQPQEVRDWFARALRDWSRAERGESRDHTQGLQRRMSQIRQQRDRLLNLRLLGEIDGDTFAAKDTELRDSVAQLTLALESADRNSSEQAELAVKVFELSQALSS